MFDDEELEQIRDEQDEWQGHVDRQTVKKSRTSRSLFLSSVGTSFVFLILLAILVSSGLMTTMALSFTGVGGFTADIGQLNGSEIVIHPALGPTAACSSDVDFGESKQYNNNNPVALPQLRGEIKSASIPSNKQLTLVKDVAIPDLSFSGADTFRVKINQSDTSNNAVELGNASLYLTGLEADKITIRDAEIREFFSDGSDSNPRFYNGSGNADILNPNDDVAPGEFSIQGSDDGGADASIKGALARAHFVAFDKLSLPNLQLSLKYLDSGNDKPSIPIRNGTGDCPHGNNP